MAGRLPVEYLLASKTEANFLKERNLDSILHKKYIDEGNNNDKHYNFDTIKHITYDRDLVIFAQQYNQEELLRLFNDPTVYYNAGRFYLNGATGTMSAILLNSQFMLYNYLLSQNVKINPYQDIVLLLHRIISMKTDEEIEKKIEPELQHLLEQERTALVNILRQINSIYKVKFGFVTKDNKKIFSIFAENIYTDIIEYLKEFAEKYKIENLDHFMIQNIIRDNNNKLYQNDYDLCMMYGPWEYMPTFIKRMDDNICNLLRNQQNLYTLESFINKYAIYINRPFELNNFIKFQKKYLKYKHKYNNLKNLLNQK